MWHHRNEKLHSNAPQTNLIRDSSLIARITQLYGEKDTFAVPDQRLFDLPLKQRLELSLRAKKHWLVLAEQYRDTTHQRKMGNQRKITLFFEKSRRKDPI